MLEEEGADAAHLLISVNDDVMSPHDQSETHSQTPTSLFSFEVFLGAECRPNVGP